MGNSIRQRKGDKGSVEIFSYDKKNLHPVKMI